MSLIGAKGKGISEWLAMITNNSYNNRINARLFVVIYNKQLF